MPIGIVPGTIKTIVLKCDRDLPEDQQTVFEIQTLSAADGAACLQVLYDQSGGPKYTYECIKRGLVGWSKFKDCDGKEVSFLNDAGVANFDALAPEYWVEIAEAIIDLNIVSEDLKKSLKSTST